MSKDWFEDYSNDEKKNEQKSSKAFYDYEIKDNHVYEELENDLPLSKSVSGMYDYSEMKRVRRRTVFSNDSPARMNKKSDHLTTKQTIISMIIGAVFGGLGIVLSMWFTAIIEFQVDFILLAVPVAIVSYWLKKNKAVTIYVVVGYCVGGYIMLFLGGAFVVGLLLFG